MSVFGKKALNETRRMDIMPHSLLTHPSIDKAFDLCYRDVPNGTDARDIPIASGHTWESYSVDGATPRMQYVDGILNIDRSANTDLRAGFLIKDFTITMPDIIAEWQIYRSIHQSRQIIFKYIDNENYISINLYYSGFIVHSCVDGETTELGRTSSSTDFPQYTINKTRMRIIEGHANSSESSYGIGVTFNNNDELFYGLSNLQWEMFNKPTKVGFAGFMGALPLKLYGFTVKDGGQS